LANVSLLDHPNPEFTELLKTSLDGSAVRQKVSLGGTDRYVVLSPLPKLGWVIGGIVPYKEILAPVRDHILIAGVIAIVACAIATFWMQGRVAFSFSRISKASSEIVGGNLGSRIEPEMPIHEFRQVSKNINQIVDTLQATITTLQEKTDSLIQREKELKEARAYAQAIVANVADPLWVIDRRGNLVLMNEAMGRITGYGHEELQDKSMLALPIFRTFIAVMDGKDKLKQLIEQVNSGEHVPEVFIPWLTKGGDMLMMSCSGESLRNVEGNAVGGVFIGKDIYALQRTGVDAMKTLSQEIEAKVGKDYELATLAFMVNSTLIIGEAALDILKGTISGYNKRFSKSVEIQKGMILKNLKHEEWPKFLEFLLERFYECIGPTTFDSAEGIVALESAINKVKNKYKSAGAT
jgi:PAS domain S-box-containing protein